MLSWLHFGGQLETSQALAILRWTMPCVSAMRRRHSYALCGHLGEQNVTWIGLGWEFGLSRRRFGRPIDEARLRHLERKRAGNKDGSSALRCFKLACFHVRQGLDGRLYIHSYCILGDASYASIVHSPSCASGRV